MKTPRNLRAYALDILGRNFSESTIALPKAIPSSISKAVGVATFVILTAVGAKVKIPLPFTPVPITLQLFFVLLSGAVLGSRLGALSQGVYVALGLVGLPVWAGKGTGLQYLVGASGGYLIGFIAAAYVVGMLTKKNSMKVGNVLLSFVGYGAGIAVIYTFGCLWLAIWANIFNGLDWNMVTVLKKGVLPFLTVDILKAFAAVPVLWIGRLLKGESEKTRKRESET